MAWTQSDLDAAEAKLAKLAAAGLGSDARVRFGDQEYSPGDIDSLRALVAEIRRSVAGNPTRRLARFSKGTR